MDAAGFEKPAGSTIRRVPAKPTETTKKKIKTAPDSEPAQDLHFTITTTSSEEFIRVAEEIKNELALLGIDIAIKTVDADHLQSDVVAAEDYDLLLASVYGAENPDPYFFWHTSQIGKGKLNIAHYQNTETDKLLEQTHIAKSQTERDAAARQFQALLVKDVPAVFLYQSMYAFTEPKKIHLNPPPQLRIPSDRFADVTDWYIKIKQTLK